MAITTQVRVKDIMTAGARCIGENDSLATAARLMADLDIGSLPICGENGKLKGMLTDRDIVVKAIANGRPAETTTAGALAEGTPLLVDAEEDVSRVLELMQQHQVRRIPVLDDRVLVGIVAEADVARSLAPKDTGETVEQITR
ncbi:CBS domain-containing protein [Microbacterium sp. ARD32]|uniref:CBS domain-containing protein n=1 Tax=Microbacterium sp. ARD32 TaxID=2962577 RepID=UPI002881A4A4|nr:CBS domain-containing protein [Microbacterium sp. ARD32]MDT0158295.1 CBS domain-containing protein [Microbacterium sp. ARD32]